MEMLCNCLIQQCMKNKLQFIDEMYKPQSEWWSIVWWIEIHVDTEQNYYFVFFSIALASQRQKIDWMLSGTAIRYVFKSIQMQQFWYWHVNRKQFFIACKLLIDTNYLAFRHFASSNSRLHRCGWVWIRWFMAYQISLIFVTHWCIANWNCCRLLYVHVESAFCGCNWVPRCVHWISLQISMHSK